MWEFEGEWAIWCRLIPLCFQLTNSGVALLNIGSQMGDDLISDNSIICAVFDWWPFRYIVIFFGLRYQHNKRKAIGMNSIKQATLPGGLDLNLKRLIRDSYENAMTAIGVSEIRYIHDKMASKLTIGRDATTPWIRELFESYEILYNIIKFCDGGIVKVDKKSYDAMVAAVFYFINPYDIIPDHTPGTGFVDDYYVLQLCIREIKPKDAPCIERCFEVERKKRAT